MSDSVVQIHEVEPHPATQMHVQPDTRVQKCHDPGPYSNIAAQIEADRVGATTKDVPRTQKHSYRGKKKCRVRCGDADMRDEIAST